MRRSVRNGWITRSRGIGQTTASAIIGGDFLLIYQIESDQINFVRVGTHSDLFEE